MPLFAESSPWLASSVSVAGVVLGALIAFGWNYRLRRRDEQRELRAAVRLLDDELAVAQEILEWKFAPWPNAKLDPEPSMPDAAWKSHQLSLARHLNEHDWATIAVAYAALTGLAISSTFSEAESAHQRRSGEQRWQRATFEALRRAREVCRRHGGPGAIETASQRGFLPKMMYLPPPPESGKDAEPVPHPAPETEL